MSYCLVLVKNHTTIIYIEEKETFSQKLNYLTRDLAVRIINMLYLVLEKSKPFARVGHKATGSLKSGIASCRKQESKIFVNLFRRME